MPGDLNLKKSWNPALVKNQKKVWEREQEALKEYQSIKQRSKEIAQEREKEELIRLQYGNDTKNLPTKQKLELNKLSWMYEDVGNTKEPKVNEAGFREVEEDFLKDKDEVERLLKGSGAMKKKPVSRFDQVTKVGSTQKVSSLDDDPLLKIQREQLRKRADHREREKPTQGSRKRERSPSADDRKDGSRSRRNHKEKSESGKARHSSTRHSSREDRKDPSASKHPDSHSHRHRSSTHRSSSHISSERSLLHRQSSDISSHGSSRRGHSKASKPTLNYIELSSKTTSVPNY